MKTIKNPILKGFNPDPSICRAGDDYFIATSTFEWYPGVQIHHSRDLINWKLAARPLRRNSQLNMLGEDNSLGIWAPCLTYHDGLFYLIYTDNKETAINHNYLVTTDDIYGDWSDPIYLNSRGFDPSFFHDDDGRKWYTVMYFDVIAWRSMLDFNRPHKNNETTKRFEQYYKEYGKERPLFKGILLQEYDPEKKQLIGKTYKIFDQVIGVTEGPHLYKKNGYYYLITAEGGTSYEHAMTMARSRSITGPYEVHPQNPLLTSYETNAVLQKAGHGDFVETQTGEVYLVHLCSRPLKDHTGCVLGRETAIQKMEWRQDGWLYLACGGNTPQVEVPAPDLEEVTWPEQAVRDDFDSSQLNIHFQWLRGEIFDQIASLTERPGHLRLKGKEMILSHNLQSLIARRQQSFNYTALTSIEFEPDEANQMAGLVVFYSTDLFYYLYIGYEPGQGKFISIMSNILGNLDLYRAGRTFIEQDKLFLKAEVKGCDLQFYYGNDEENWQKIGPVLDHSLLCDETSGGFTGAFAGMACHDPATLKKEADFDFFEYREF